MANFSYLFLSNAKPPRVEKAQSAPMQHISTGRNDVPFAFKLLLSGEPEAIRASDGGPRKSFYLVGDRRSGVERLAAFLRRIDLPDAQPVIDKTLSFLDKPEHRRTFFVLDPTAIFDLSEESHATQAQRLVDEIANIEATFEYEFARLNEPLGPMTLGPGAKPGFIARLFGAKQRPARQVPFPEPLYRFGQAGLLNWHG